MGQLSIWSRCHTTAGGWVWKLLASTFIEFVLHDGRLEVVLSDQSSDDMPEWAGDSRERPFPDDLVKKDEETKTIGPSDTVMAGLFRCSLTAQSNRWKKRTDWARLAAMTTKKSSQQPCLTQMHSP